MSGNSPEREYNASYNTIDYGMWNITLTTRATIEKNNTRVKCLATGIIGGQIATGNINISVAGKI